MTDENRIERLAIQQDGVVEERSAGKAAYDAAMAFGAATGGAGTLALGAAAVKQTFGSKKQPTEPQQPKKD
jgi:hypothetical protein